MLATVPSGSRTFKLTGRPDGPANPLGVVRHVVEHLTEHLEASRVVGTAKLGGEGLEVVFLPNGERSLCPIRGRSLIP